MMNFKSRYFFLSLSFILFTVSCNKDEVLINDSMPPESPSSRLGYSVVEYTPAPGQFINENVSVFENVNTMTEACTLAESRLMEGRYVSLGAWGGYIVVKLNKSLQNIKGYNFAIAGNSFDSSNEPGIVWVMQDVNQNGIPDDTWYELAGSYFDKPGYQRDYWVTYYKPDSKGDTFWRDSDGEEGYVKWMGSFHSQDFYYPQWIDTDSYTLHGSRLPARPEQDPVTGIWSNLPYEWGYVDNHGEDIATLNINGIPMEANKFRLYDAVDGEGYPVEIKAIDFIKVQTAVNSSIGILGENSTEVCGFYFFY